MGECEEISISHAGLQIYTCSGCDLHHRGYHTNTDTDIQTDREPARWLLTTYTISSTKLKTNIVQSQNVCYIIIS